MTKNARFIWVAALIIIIIACISGCCCTSNDKAVAENNIRTETTVAPPAAPTSTVQLITALSISNVNVVVEANKATVSWFTDRPTMGEVVYGTNAKKATDFDYTTSHSVTLSGLYPGTMYHYKVRATDIDGNTVSSSTQVFTAFRYDYYYHYDHYYYYDHHRSLPHQNYHYDHHYDHYYRSYRR